MAVFTPIRTARLLVRSVTTEDAEALHERRNDPTVAELQDWTLPYTMDRATEAVATISRMDGPQDGEWWMATVVESDSGEIIGDVAVQLAWEGRSAEIGYSFASSHWGRGYAVEAVDGLVEWLFDGVGVTRLSATLHPDNRASAMVLERTGFLFEGHTRLSYWVGDEVSDDWLYGLVREDRENWKNRPTQPPSEVRLVEVTAANSRRVLELKTHKSQEAFVAPMSQSYADALFPEIVDGAPVEPWMRAVVADGEILGFVMLAVTTEHHPEPFLWRLLIDRLHQRRGIGRRVLGLIREECLARGDETLLTSWVEGKGSPAPFYLGFGFAPTGEIVDDEIEARVSLV